LRQHKVQVLLFVMIFALAACTGSATQYPPTIPPREVTAVPTTDPNLPTPTINPSAVAQTPSGIESGGGTYTTRNGTLTFNYPQGWFVQEAGGQVLIVNDRAALESTPRSGQFQVNIVVSPVGEYVGSAQDPAQANVSALDALNQLAGQYATTGTEVGEAFEDSMGGRTAYFVRIRNATFEALLSMVDVNGTHIALAGVASRGELTLLEPVARTIGASIQYTP
jgi:hypothetical protein